MLYSKFYSFVLTIPCHSKVTMKLFFGAFTKAIKKHTFKKRLLSFRSMKIFKEYKSTKDRIARFNLLQQLVLLSYT